MNKIRRITSLVVAMAMIMSMSTICFIATVVTVSGASSVPDGTMWKFDDTFAIGDVGSTAVLESGNFGLAMHDNGYDPNTTAPYPLSATVVAGSDGVPSIVSSYNQKRAFSKSATGIIDINAETGSPIVYFKAPVDGTYYYELEVTGAWIGTTVKYWAGMGVRNDLLRDTSFTNTEYVGLGNTDPTWNNTHYVYRNTVTVTAGQLILFRPTNDGCNSANNAMTLNKFNVFKVSSDAIVETFNCSIGTPDNTNAGDCSVGNFQLGTVYNNKPFTPVYDEDQDLSDGNDSLVAAWGNPTFDPATGLSDTTYTGYRAYVAGTEYTTKEIYHGGSTTYDSSTGTYGGYWAWAHVTKDVSGTITNYFPIFSTPQVGPAVDMSPKMDVPAIITYTAPGDGKYMFDSSFKAIGWASGPIVMTVATGADGYMMSVNEPNYFSETKTITANTTINFNGMVELKEGQSIWFIAENPDNVESAEIGVMNIEVTYLPGHACSEFEGADCQTAGTCVLCGEQTGAKDPDNHTAEATGYTDLGNGTHRVSYDNCCQTPAIEAHDFTSGVCACGANYSESDAEYVVAITSPATSVTGGNTVDINVELTGAATKYASGEAVITYDPNVFTYTDVSPDDVFVVSPDSYEGKLVLMITGDNKTLGSGFNTVATLSFVANRDSDLSGFVLEKAGFSTAEQAKNGGVTPAEIYSDSVIPPMYNVTVIDEDGIVSAAQTAKYGDPFTFNKASDGDSLYTYAVSYTMGGQTTSITATEGVYTIPSVTAAVTITVEKTLDTDVSVVQSAYLAIEDANGVETKMWLVLNDMNRLDGRTYTVNGEKMLWSKRYDAYCYLVIAASAPAKESLTIDVINVGTTDVDYDSMDVNISGIFDANDAQLVYNMINADYSTFDDVPMEKFLRADVNATVDYKIDILDVTAICTKCAAEEAQKPNEDIVEE